VDFVPQRTLAVESLRETFAEFGIPLKPEEVIVPQLSHWMTPPIFPDARSFLDRVRILGLPVCVVSNVDRSDIESAIAAHGLEFAGLVTSEDARSYKPRPEMFQLALDALGLDSDEVLHIGDSWSSDVGGARGVGIRVAWVNRTGRPGGIGPEPEWDVPDLSDLSPIFDRLLS
jgi:2-haloacid dehalogenase/putative hydrolase of the HAD superfamily